MVPVAECRYSRWSAVRTRDERKHPATAGQYRFSRCRDSRSVHSLVRRARVTITPEAAVFSAAGKLVYHGRIDNRFVELGKAMSTPTRRDLEDAIAAALDGRPQPEASAPAVGCYLADVE